MFDIVHSLTERALKLVPKTISMLQSIQAMRSNPNAIPVEAKSAEDATELHISLTRPIYLQELHIGRFVADVREAFKGKKRYECLSGGLFSSKGPAMGLLILKHLGYIGSMCLSRDCRLSPTMTKPDPS